MPRRRIRRWVRRIGLGLAALTLVLVGALLAALFTETGTRFVVERGVSIYAGMIPGHASVESVEGTLAGGMTLHGVRLEDRHAQALVEVRSLELRIDPAALLAGSVAPGTIRIEAPRIHALEFDDGGFGDLGPEGPPEEAPPSLHHGPELPVDLVGRIEIVDGVVFAGPPGAPSPVVVVPELALDLVASGLEAHATLVGRASLPAAGLEIFHLFVELDWADPAARVQSVFVQTNAGDVTLESARLDLATEAFAVAQLEVDPDPQWLAERASWPTRGASVEIEAAGTTADFSVDVHATLVDGGSVAVGVFGAIAPELDLHAWIDAGLDDARVVGAPQLPALSIEAGVDAHGDPSIGTHAGLAVTCFGCAGDLGPLVLDAEGFAGGGGSWGFADVELRAADLRVDAGAVIDPNGVGGLTAELRIPALEALSPVLERFAPGLDLAGELAVDVACALVLDPRASSCHAALGLQRGRPVRRAELEVLAVVDDAIAIDVRELVVEARDARIELRRPTARLRYGQDRIAVDDFDVLVSNRSGAGRVELSGSASLTEPRNASAHLQVRNLAASAVNAFVPDLRARGRIDATLDLDGMLSAPNVVASVSGSGLGAKDLSFGNVDVSASYRDGRARARLELAGGDLGRARASADIPAVVDLAAGSVALHGGESAHAELDVEGFPLAVLRRFVDGVDTLTGEVGLSVDLGRSLQRPRVDAELSVSDASFDGKPLPNVAVEAVFVGDTLTANLVATHPSAFERVQLDARVPLTLNLARADARWRSEREHRIDLSVVGARVEHVRAWAPNVVAGGRVDLELGVHGSMLDPEIDGELHGAGLSYRERPIGDVAMSLRWADAMAEVDLHASGPALAGVGMEADVPITLSPARRQLQWHAERDHRIRVSINELLVEQALAWVPPAPGESTAPIAASGRLDAEVELDGPATAPIIALDTTLGDAVYARRDVGEVRLRADYGDGRVSATVDWEQAQRHAAQVRVEAPFLVDIAHGRYVWDREGDHHLRVEVPRIDRAMLDPFVDTGKVDATLALYVVGDGNAEAFDLDASLTGSLGAGSSRYPVRARFDASQDAQSLHMTLGPTATPWGKIVASTHLPVFGVIRGADWKSTSLEVDATLVELDLRAFAAFMPVEIQDVAGKLSANARVGGTLGAPDLDGRVNLRAGAATIVPARQRIERLELAAVLDNDSVDLTNLRFEAGDGSVHGRGGVTLREGEGLVGAIDLSVDDLPIRSPGLPRMAMSSKVATKVAMGRDDLAVEIRFAETQVDVYTSKITAGKPIATNENVLFVDFDDPQPHVAGAETRAGAPSRDTRVAIVLADPLRIVGPSVDMSWRGRIESDAKGTSGALTADKGTFDLLGNDFDVEHGAVTLPDDGSNRPFVDVVARADVDDVQIKATIRGKLPKPELILSSSPAMSQSEIFTVLVTGSSDTGSADQDEVEAKAASVLAAMSNPALQRHLDERLHVDRVGVGFGESTEQPILSVGKNVTKKVYAETQYHHNAPRRENRAELRVEYRFAKRWSVETFFGDAAAGGVDLFWGRAFDTPVRQR
jgi:autotransporter translocation and assembly factor TamB